MKVLLTGANSVVGGVLRDQCAVRGLEVTPSGRAQRARGWVAWDMIGHGAPDGRFEALLHAAPLWLLPRHVEHLAGLGVKRIVCYSSTSLVTKKASTDRGEREVAAALVEAERRILSDSARLGIDATILRPTMIYGFGRDGNISAIARFIGKYGFFPVAGRACGRRQPIHAEDAAGASIAALERPETFGRTYVITGGETLAYRDMVGRLFDALGTPRRIVSVPVRLYGLVLELARLLGREASGAMARRMNEDLVFDVGEAVKDFGFSPQCFLEQPERDLVRA